MRSSLAHAGFRWKIVIVRLALDLGFSVPEADTGTGIRRVFPSSSLAEVVPRPPGTPATPGFQDPRAPQAFRLAAGVQAGRTLSFHHTGRT